MQEFTGKGVPKEQAEVAVALMEARAKVAHPNNPDVYYREIQDIGKGEFQSNDIKPQGEFKKLLLVTSMALHPLDTAKLKVDFSDKQTITQSVQENKNTKLIEKVLNDYYSINEEQVPKEVMDRAKHLWDIYGKPELLGDSTNKNERAYATKDKTDTLGNITDFDDFVAEIAHAAQYKSGAELNTATYGSQKEYDAKEYDRKGSTEYDAHKILEPILANYIFSGRKGEELIKTTNIPDNLKKELVPTLKKYNIKFQGNRGALETLDNGRKIIHALNAPDFSTTVHEIAHVFESEISNNERTVINDWAGTKEWDTKTSEAFATGFERYLRDGNAPTPELKTIFQKAAEWLKIIYQTLKGSAIEKKISPEVKKVFDNLFKEQPSKKSEVKDKPEIVKLNEQRDNDIDLANRVKISDVPEQMDWVNVTLFSEVKNKKGDKDTVLGDELTKQQIELKKNYSRLKDLIKCP